MPKQDKKIEFNPGTGKFENISESQLVTWRETYTLIDVDKNIKKAQNWLAADFTKRKKKNYHTFLVKWLSSEENKFEKLGKSPQRNNQESQVPDGW